jgi:hypothetical protein
MSTMAQWVAYRAEPGKLLRAPLPSAPQVGEGWRGVELRRVHPLDQLDDLVVETAGKVGAAIGLASGGDHGYVIAAARDGAEPVRLVLGVDPVRASGEAAAAAARCGAVPTAPKGWRKAAAKALSAWSQEAPACVTAAPVAELLGDERDPSELLEELLGMLGLGLPPEAIPDPLDLQDVARRQLARRAGRAGTRRRWLALGRRG